MPLISKIPSLNDFKSLGLSDELLKVLDSIGFSKPTEIQEKAIPVLLEDVSDFIGLAQTGTGKTAAFGLPLIQSINPDLDHTQAVILAPTRELSQQTAKQLVQFSEGYKELNVKIVYGGANIQTQIKSLKSPSQILVATPGRLIDLIKRKAVNLAKTEIMILDEADEMLNMGFQEEIDEILSYIKSLKCTWLFSATMPKEVRKIVKKYMADPKEIAVNQKIIGNTDIDHQYIVVKNADKLDALKRYIDLYEDMKGIMFCRTKRETQAIADQLSNEGYDVEALHGDLSQAQRDAAMNRFKQRNLKLLIATDVAARGIDVDHLSHVIHHSLPDQLENYTHRSGRTGRAGNKGISLVFANPREGRRIQEFERKLKLTFTQDAIPNVDQIKDARARQWARNINGQEIDSKIEELYAVIESDIESLTKEELVKKMMTKELKSLFANEHSGKNLNQSLEKSSNSRDEGDRSKQRKGRDNRYQINIGTKDGLTKKDLAEFVSEVGGVKFKSINDISIQDKRAFFNILEGEPKNFEGRFEGLELENGHPIRVTLEVDRGQRGFARKQSRKGRDGRDGRGGRKGRR